MGFLTIYYSEEPHALKDFKHNVKNFFFPFPEQQYLTAAEKLSHAERIATEFNMKPNDSVDIITYSAEPYILRIQRMAREGRINHKLVRFVEITKDGRKTCFIDEMGLMYKVIDDNGDDAVPNLFDWRLSELF